MKKFIAMTPEVKRIGNYKYTLSDLTELCKMIEIEKVAYDSDGQRYLTKVISLLNTSSTWGFNNSEYILFPIVLNLVFGGSLNE